MDYDDTHTEELEAELYSRIHHDQPDSVETSVNQPEIQNIRIVSKHSIVNNSKVNKKTTAKNRKQAPEKCNPNPFAIASAMNKQIPKRLTPYTSYLSQVDSQPISLENDKSPQIEAKNSVKRPNPFNQGFNRTEAKMYRLQLMQSKKDQADRIRDSIEQKKKTEVVVPSKNGTQNAIAVPDSDSDDEVYIYPPEEPTVISSDEGDAMEHNAPEPVNNLHDDCEDMNVDYDKRLSRHEDPFSGIDVSELNSIVGNVSNALPSINESFNRFANFAKPQRANRNSLKRSYHVSETDFAATDVYESESSDLPEMNAPAGKNLSAVPSESDGSDIDTTKRSKRMRKRKASGSNRGSDCISSDDSDDDHGAYIEPEKSTRPYYLHRGEGVFNAVTKYSKRLTGRRNEQSQKIPPDAVVSSDDSQTYEAENEQANNGANWIVTDEVGETDAVEIELPEVEDVTSADNNVQPEVRTQEKGSDRDKDDENSVRSKRLVVHPEMGWNDEMKAFYNDSWGGETHNALAIRKRMPIPHSAFWEKNKIDEASLLLPITFPEESYEWRLDSKDLRSNFNVLKTIKCHNCRENGHRAAFCPLPKKEVICYTCGSGGHREVRCPKAICLRCGGKTNSYRRGCDRCHSMANMVCNKCHRRGHVARECPDNWRAYHNTTDSVSQPDRQSLVQSNNKRYCSVCARPGHRAEQCYDFKFFLQDEPIPSYVKHYEKIYPDENPPIDNSSTTPYSMFENPREDFKFKWNVNESSDRVYGRFMEATNIQRERAHNVSRHKQKKVNPTRLNEKLVLNPMNAQNIREKPKKQFSKKFYEESSGQTAGNLENVAGNVDKDNSHEEPISCHNADHDDARDSNADHDDARDNNADHDNTDRDNDVEMKGVEAVDTSANVCAQNCDEQITEPIVENTLMNETIEKDKSLASINFSFTKELNDLENSKAKFDSNFIRKSDKQRQRGDDQSDTITKSTARKMRNEAEIERLTVMEISLNKLKDQLNKNKSTNDIVLNVSCANDKSLHSVNDSDSNYSFGEYFSEPQSESKGPESQRQETSDFIPLPPHIDAADMANAIAIVDTSTHAEKPVNSAKIFLTKQHARLLLSTETGNQLLSNASATHHVKVRMDWENLGNVLIVVGSTVDQNRFHADLIRFLVDMCKKMRIKNETFQQIPRSKVALIRFIRDQFALLEQPLGNVNELYKNMKRNENLKSKNGTKNADRARKHLNIILMGRAGLRDGRLHLAGLESNLKFLLDNNKDLMTKHTRAEIYQHYRYVFSSFEHDDYPDLIAQFEEMKRAKSFTPVNIDKSLLEIKISVKNEGSGEFNRAKQKLMRFSNDIGLPMESQAKEVSTSDAVPEATTPKMNRIKTPKQQPKLPKPEPKVQTKHGEPTDLASKSSVNDSASPNKNAVWSLKCKEIVEQCRQKHITSSKVTDKLNTVLEKASRNQLSYADYKNLEKILNNLNRTV